MPDKVVDYELRCRAIRMHQQRMRHARILGLLGRGRSWLAKWLGRFKQLGWAGLQAQSRAPRRQPTRTPERVVAAVLAVRAELQAHRSRASRFSGIGAEAIRLQLPLARGRVSFIRKINDHGCIQVNGQPYFIGKRLARQYVTATVYPHRRTLVVKHEGRVRKRFAFPVHERLIAPLSRPHKP